MLQQELVSWVLIALINISPAAGVSSGKAVGQGVALRGYDPVAYFLEERPVLGNSDIGYEWNGARWQFSSARNRDIFMSNPGLYAPRYGGHCTLALSRGHMSKGDPGAWLIADGKLYLTHNKEARNLLKRSMTSVLKKADTQWGVLGKRAYKGA